MTEERNDVIASVNRVTINNTKLVNRLKLNGSKLRSYWTLPEGTQYYSVNTGKGYKGAEVRIRLDGSALEGSGDPNNTALDLMDFLILDTAYLFCLSPLSEKYGERFTVRKFYKVMTGGECSGRNVSQLAVSPQRLEKLEKRIDRLSKIKISIDFRSENQRAAESERHESGFIEAPLLPLKKTERVSEYEINGAFPLYEYASVNKQVIVADAAQFFCNDGSRSNTDIYLVTNYYLIHEIKVMIYRNEKEKDFKDDTIVYYHNDANKLCLFDILKPFGMERKKNASSETAEKKINPAATPAVLNKLRSIHDIVTGILDKYKENGLIKDYKTLRYSDSGKAGPKGVKIEL